MTTKEIAKAVGKDERSVRRWVASVADKMSVIADKMTASNSTHPADYTLDETVAIIEKGLGKNASALFRENAEKSQITPREEMALIVRETVTSMLPALIAAIRGALPESTALALPAPEEISYRDELRKVMNRYGRKIGDFGGAWSQLYTEFYYRYHTNLRERAKNRQMEILDYAEAEGFLPDLLSLALKITEVAA